MEARYRPIPFWSWNDKLTPAETRTQIRRMKEAGIGGFFMHARGGLMTPYMQDEWFENVDAAIDEAEKQGMEAWAYDENGWPSGFGNGVVNGMGEAYQQKYLRMESGEKHTPRTLANIGGFHLYYEINPYYVDTLYKPATDLFIDTVYRPYAQRYAGRLKGIFTDEPQISRNGIPWSFAFAAYYENRYGESILSKLPLLFVKQEGYETFRIRFWKMVTDLFSENFMKPIYTFCRAHGLLFTGHLVLEESLQSQLTPNGAIMPHYEYFDIPGMDWLGRHVTPSLTARQVSSVAQQLGKRQVLSETFALCGHNLSFDEMRWIYESQMVRGINLLCTHLQGYTLRGIRKRDYPPAMYYQQPWWPHFEQFVTPMTRIGKHLCEGTPVVDTLLLHPQTTAWICFDGTDTEAIQAYNRQLLSVVDRLESAHVEFHLGDETILERHGRVEAGRLVVGEMSYGTIIIPPHIRFLDTTNELLERFQSEGGTVLDAAIISNPKITSSIRNLGGDTLYYFVNSTRQSQQADIHVGTCVINPATGERQPFERRHTFPPFSSLLVLAEKGKAYEVPAFAPPPDTIDLQGDWALVQCSLNTFLLERCDYWFDGVQQAENGWTIDIQDKACALKRPVEIRLRYHFHAESVPDTLYLLCETPEIYQFRINGKPFSIRDEGWHLDTAFRKIRMDGYVVPGENTIEMCTRFTQPQAVYDCLEKARQFESEKNKLSYEMEIEPLMLLGDFAVRTPGAYTALPRDAVRYHGAYSLRGGFPKTITLQAIQAQGFPYFAGSMTVRKTVTLPDGRGQFRAEKKGLNVLRVRANGGAWHTMLFSPCLCDLSADLRPGENEIEMELIGNVRNLLGPHHLQEGESYRVTPGIFFRSPGVWNGGRPVDWDDDACFVEVAVTMMPSAEPRMS